MIRTPKQTSLPDGLNHHAGAVRLKAALQFGLAALALVGAWWPMQSWLVLLTALAPAWVLLTRTRWGRDQTWVDGAWTDTSLTVWRAGIAASGGASLREPAAAHKGVWFWCLALAAALVSSLPWWLDRNEAPALEPLLVTLVLAALLLLALHTAIVTHTRHIQWDDAGLSERHFFGTRRVPWSAIASLAPLVKAGAGTGGANPDHGVAWMLSDSLGRRVMTLDAGLAPVADFVALRQQIERLSHPRSQAAEDTQDAAARDDGTEDDEAQAADASQVEWLAMRDRMTHQRSLRDPQNIMMVLTMVLVLLPFLLGTLYLCWSALWFSVVASRVAGEVVEVDRAGVTSLLVEYPVADGRRLRIKTGGSDLYAHYNVGDTLQVLYDPRDPADARADLFLELWLLPMLLGGLTLLLALAMGLIAWGMTRPFMPP